MSDLRLPDSYGYQANTKLSSNERITDPNVPDPENFPIPLGWHVLIRPYPIVVNKEKTSLHIPGSEMEFMNRVSNMGRIIAVGSSCWNRPEHKDAEGRYKPWASVGDFVTYPKNVGVLRNFKGVSLILLSDDEINEFLPDPQVFNESRYKFDIPMEHLKKYNTIYNKKFKG